METHERIELLERGEQLRKLLSQLSAWVAEHAIGGEVYPLPVLSESEIPPLIVPHFEKGGEAIRIACEALTRIDRLKDQHPSTVMRVPGWVQLSDDPTEHLAEINELKISMRDTLRTAFSTTSIRSKACRELFPSVQMNQLYRQIHVVDPATARMSFHWQPRSSASTHLTVREAVSLLRQAQADESLMNDSASMEAVEIALERISCLSDGGPFQLICRTPLAPHPRVALFAEGEGKALVTHHANIPLLLPPRDPSIRVRQLPTFDAQRRGKPRGRPQLLLESLCELVHLYYFRTDASPSR